MKREELKSCRAYYRDLKKLVTSLCKTINGIDEMVEVLNMYDIETYDYTKTIGILDTYVESFMNMIRETEKNIGCITGKEIKPWYPKNRKEK